MLAARRGMRRRWSRFVGSSALVVAIATIVACGPTIEQLNLRPDKFYQQKVSFRGQISRMQIVGGDTLLELADPHERLILVRTSRPVEYQVGDWVKVTGVLVPEARVADRTVYDVVTAEEIDSARAPFLPNLM